MKKILIVDDEIDLCMMVKLYLTKKNYDVYIALSLNDGLEIIYSIQPDALLLDNNLPDALGWEIAGTLQEKFPDMHIILISAHRDAIEFKNMLGKGIKVLQKPLSLADIEQFL